MYIFIDESGDLGSRKGASQFFILTALIIPETRSIDRAIKFLRRSLKKKNNNISEFHAYHIQPRLRNKLLKRLAKIPQLSIAFISYRKQRVLTAEQQEELYGQFSEDLLFEICKQRKGGLKEPVVTVFDKRYAENFYEKFKSGAGKRLEKKCERNFFISSAPSESIKGLQGADFVSWSIFRYFEYGETQYFSINKDKIIFGKTL